MLSINAVKGFEFGSGFNGTKMYGSEHNDQFDSEGKTVTNFSGEIQGGISNGMDIFFNVAFKPVATIMKSQKTINKDGDKKEIKGKGRHDPCVVPRAVHSRVSSTLVILDSLLLNNKRNLMSLHIKIIIGMVVGVLFGFLMSTYNGGTILVTNWIKPFGTIFINAQAYCHSINSCILDKRNI